MKNKRLLKVLYLLSMASLLLPWFSYNPRMMGYCWGLSFAKWFALPMAVLGVSLFARPESKPLAILGEFSAAINLLLCVMAFGRWQVFANIAAGFRWADGWRTARPGFWVAAALFFLLFAVFSWGFAKGQLGRTEKE